MKKINGLLILNIISCGKEFKLDNTYKMLEQNSEQNLEIFKKNMEIEENKLQVELIDLDFEENISEIETQSLEDLINNFEISFINRFKDINLLKDFNSLKIKLLDKEISDRFSSGGNEEISEKNNSSVIRKLKEIFYFLSNEEDIEKINRIINSVKEGFRYSTARTVLEIEDALAEIKEFEDLKNKINFYLNKSRESVLDLASADHVSSLTNEDNQQNPHMIIYIRNIMKDDLKLKEDYYSIEDANNYNKKYFSKSPIDKNLIKTFINEMYSADWLINTIEDKVKDEELEKYLGTKLSELNVEETLGNRELKRKALKAILIKLGHLKIKQ